MAVYPTHGENMNSRRWFYIVMMVWGLLMLAPMAMGQDCESDIPLQLDLHSSYCIQVCPWEEYVFFLWCPYEGCENFPHLSMAPGCLSGGPDCNSDCNPIDPPTWPWRPGEPPTFGGDPHQQNAI